MEMEIVYEIIISERAENNLDQIISYLLTEWNESVKNTFLDSFKKNLNMLKTNPFMFQVYSKPQRISKCLISNRLLKKSKAMSH
jgi:plasmid stabilization system protein ParE